jgi:translation initiation factor IF-2
MSDSQPDKIPETQPASAGGPPGPPTKTAQGLGDESPDGRHIDIPDPVILKELATALGQRPFRIVADVLELGCLVFAGDAVDFETASKVAKKYGFQTRHVG